jgi:hypothetical protein
MNKSKVPTAIWYLYLTEPSLLDFLACDQANGIIQKDKLFNSLLLMGRAKFPKLPEHQLRLALEEAFPLAIETDCFFLRALESLAQRFFTESNNEIRFRRQNVLEWVEEYSHRLTTLPFMSSHLAKSISVGKNRNQAIKKIFRGPMIPLTDDPDLESIMHSGLVETHLHFNGTALPSILWEQVLTGRGKWIDEVYKSQEWLGLWRLALPEIEPKKLFGLLRVARWTRRWLVFWSLSNYLPSHLEKYLTQALSNELLGALPEPPLPLVRHPGKLLLSCEGDNPQVAEGAFWVNTLANLRHTPCPLVVKMLHAYHLIFTCVVRVLVQQINMIGFDLFERLSGTPLRDATEEHMVRERLIQLQRNSLLSGLEARVSVKESAEKTYIKKVKPVLDGYDRALRRGEVSYQLGLICHFIKRPDRDRSNHRALAGRFTSCRHARLRDSLISQALSIIKIRRDYSNLRDKIVGLDGAGNELKAPPEVFAPIYRMLQELNSLSSLTAKIRFTFHAGEEFSHLLSGIRAVDEALTFLKLPPGSRLGHCLALGFSAGLWLQRAWEVRLPRLEWLDDLVWLNHHLLGPAELKQYLSELISELSRQIYGHLGPNYFPPNLLYEAWRLRELGFTSKERSLASQKDRCRELRAQTSSQAWKMVEAYHYDEEVWRRGSETVVAEIREEFREAWQASLTFAQLKVLAKIAEMRIAVEACPVSNLRISQLEKVSEHPIFDWHPPGPSGDTRQLKFLVATDNTGVFQTSLPLEYSILSYAAQEKDRAYSGPVIANWLRRIIDDTKSSSFLQIGSQT